MHCAVSQLVTQGIIMHSDIVLTESNMCYFIRLGEFLMLFHSQLDSLTQQFVSLLGTHWIMTEWCCVAVSCGTHSGAMVLSSLLERTPNSCRIRERQSLSAQASIGY